MIIEVVEKILFVVSIIAFFIAIMIIVPDMVSREKLTSFRERLKQMLHRLQKLVKTRTGKKESDNHNSMTYGLTNLLWLFIR